MWRHLSRAGAVVVHPISCLAFDPLLSSDRREAREGRHHRTDAPPGRAFQTASPAGQDRAQDRRAAASQKGSTHPAHLHPGEPPIGDHAALRAARPIAPRRLARGREPPAVGDVPRPPRGPVLLPRGGAGRHHPARAEGAVFRHRPGRGGAALPRQGSQELLAGALSGRHVPRGLVRPPQTGWTGRGVIADHRMACARRDVPRGPDAGAALDPRIRGRDVEVHRPSRVGGVRLRQVAGGGVRVSMGLRQPGDPGRSRADRHQQVDRGRVRGVRRLAPGAGGSTARKAWTAPRP